MQRWHLVEGIDLWTSVNSFAGQHVPQVNHLWLGEDTLQVGIAVRCHKAFLVDGTDSVNVLPLLHHCRECRPGKRLHRADHW